MNLLDWYGQAWIPRDVACHIFGYSPKGLRNFSAERDGMVQVETIERHIIGVDSKAVGSVALRQSVRQQKARLVIEVLGRRLRNRGLDDLVALYDVFASALWSRVPDLWKLRELVRAASAIDPSRCVNLAIITAALQHGRNCQWEELERWVRRRGQGRLRPRR